MRRSLARYSAPVSSVHAPSWADFITTMVGFRVSVHTAVDPDRTRRSRDVMTEFCVTMRIASDWKSGTVSRRASNGRTNPIVPASAANGFPADR